MYAPAAAGAVVTRYSADSEWAAVALACVTVNDRNVMLTPAAPKLPATSTMSRTAMTSVFNPSNLLRARIYASSRGPSGARQEPSVRRPSPVLWCDTTDEPESSLAGHSAGWPPAHVPSRTCPRHGDHHAGGTPTGNRSSSAAATDGTSGNRPTGLSLLQFRPPTSKRAMMTVKKDVESNRPGEAFEQRTSAD